MTIHVGFNSRYIILITIAQYVILDLTLHRPTIEVLSILKSPLKSLLFEHDRVELSLLIDYLFVFVGAVFVALRSEGPVVMDSGLESYIRLQLLFYRSNSSL